MDYVQQLLEREKLQIAICESDMNDLREKGKQIASYEKTRIKDVWCPTPLVPLMLETELKGEYPNICISRLEDNQEHIADMCVSAFHIKIAGFLWLVDLNLYQARIEHISRKRKEAQIKISLLEDILRNMNTQLKPCSNYVEAEIIKDTITLSYEHSGMKITEIINMRQEIKEKAIRQWLINNGWTPPHKLVTPPRGEY